jgi:hypothetical protein
MFGGGIFGGGGGGGGGHGGRGGHGICRVFCGCRKGSISGKSR